MSRERRTLRDAARLYRGHLNRLLAHTISHKPLVAVFEPTRSEVTFGFRDGASYSDALIRTRFGLMYLGIIQSCVASGQADSMNRLRLTSYQHTLSSDDSSEPTFRWEYVSRDLDSTSRWSRHHVQGLIPTGIGGTPGVPLNDFHLPTGPVPIEEIIRFCIIDLGVPEPQDDWDTRLRDSVALTRAEFLAE